MGCFDPGTDFIVKMTTCRSDVHSHVHAKCAHAAAPGSPFGRSFRDLLNACLARSPDGILNDMAFDRFTGDYD